MYGDTFYNRHTAQITRMWQWNIGKKESPSRQNCKMMQARFDWACSWTIIESASYRPHPFQQCTRHSYYLPVYFQTDGAILFEKSDK
jgi:hypothetical protein